MNSPFQLQSGFHIVLTKHCLTLSVQLTVGFQRGSTVLPKINWPLSNKLIENHKKCIISKSFGTSAF